MSKLKILFAAILLCITPYVFAQDASKDNTVTFYVTRHGKTILNTLVQAQGWADTPLTPPGVAVAEYLGIGMKDVPLKAAYSSDLGRARQTARIVLEKKGQKSLLLQEDEGLREACFGSYEGKPDEKMWGDAALRIGLRNMKEFFEAMKTDNQVYINAMQALKDLDELGMAENYYDVKKRGQAAFKAIAEKEAKLGGGNVLVVVHGMFIGILLSDLDSSGKFIQPTHLGNASVSKVVYKDGKFIVESVGDMSYVEKGKAASN